MNLSMELWDILDSEGRNTGRSIERGKRLKENEFHLVVHVWIRNARNEYLISRRTPNKTFPNMWDTVGGSVIAGETSIEAAVREVEEEIGLKLDIGNGTLLKRLKRFQYESPDFVDVWFFPSDVEISDLKFQPDEVSDAKWANNGLIMEMIKNDEMVDVYTYIEDVFNFKKT